ncbi:MAG TPA: hypothetical protein VKT80_08870, partial [Chloroflexota bacterium]|nr:hypothetical protein [Chloroflexota bacterium]
MRHRWFSFVLATTLFLGAATGSTAVAGAGSTPNVIPFHPINSQYSAIKAGIDAQARAQDAQDSSATSPDTQPLAPTAPVKWVGLGPNGFSPSDARGAISPTEYIETVNVSVAVYNRAGVLTSSASQPAWTGIANARGDADIVWDNNQNRYFASMLNIGSNYQLIFGFSKGPTPSAAANNWCFYTSTFGGVYGANLPDYPKLGMTNDFMLMGVNTFQNGQNYIGSDVAWVSKPPAGVIVLCPAISSFTMGVKQSLKNVDGSSASTPVPANLVDGGGTGYVVANEDPGGGVSTVLSLFTVTKVGTS